MAQGPTDFRVCRLGAADPLWDTRWSTPSTSEGVQDALHAYTPGGGVGVRESGVAGRTRVVGSKEA